MVARRYDVSPQLENLLRMFFGNPFSFRRILAIDDEEIHAVFLEIIWNQSDCKLQSGLANDIARASSGFVLSLLFLSPLFLTINREERLWKRIVDLVHPARATP